MTEVVDRQSHLDAILVARKLAQCKPSIIDENVNMLETFFDFSSEILNGFFACQIQDEILDKMIVLFQTLFFLLANANDCFLVSGLVSTAKHNVMSPQVEIFHSLKPDSTITTCDNDIKRLFLHEFYYDKREFMDSIYIDNFALNFNFF